MVVLTVEAPDVARAVAAAMSIVSALDLTVDDAQVLQNSNKLALRLLPCDVFARVAHVEEEELAAFEVELALRLAEAECPVAALEPRVESRVYERDGFAVTLWTYYESGSPAAVAPDDYADALAQLHAGMRKLDVATPHFTDRVAEAQLLVESRDLTPALADLDRELLGNTLRSLRQTIVDRGAAEQLLHGEPHPGNVLRTERGLRFIDLETCCRGPVEFDLAHVPEEVSARYPNADNDLLRDCRILVLAMVAAWRWDRGDQFPNGQRAGRELLNALRDGPPYPELDAVMGS
jgi:aminoglycoside phosphotransferase (APT) family kinase protein